MCKRHFNRFENSIQYYFYNMYKIDQCTTDPVLNFHGVEAKPITNLKPDIYFLKIINYYIQIISLMINFRVEMPLK